MLLVEVTINGNLKRVSIEGLALEHYWDQHIISIDPPQYRIQKPYGGYVRPGFGSISFSHELFSDNWPPPVGIDIKKFYTETNEADKELLFEGKAHLRSITRDAITYELFSDAFSTTIADSTLFDDSLVNVVTWFCDSSRLNLSVNSTYARNPSPAVKHTTSGEQLAVNLLSDICAFFTHLFYIENGTLYLIDMLGDAGSESLTEFDFFPSVYDYDVPVSAVRSNSYVRMSSYPYGNELNVGTEYHDTQSNIEDALDDILSIVNKAKCRLRVPLEGSLPKPGKKISWTDTSLGRDTSAYIRCRSIRYDFIKYEAVIEGEGEISAV